MYVIPLEFPDEEYPTSADEGKQRSAIQISEGPELTSILWKDAGLELWHSRDAVRPDPKDIGRHTPSFRIHGATGFTLGRYSEFLVRDEAYGYVTRARLQLGPISASLGAVTPLANYIMHGLDEWAKEYLPAYLQSIRILGVDATDAEEVLLNALFELNNRTGYAFELEDLGWYLDSLEDPTGAQDYWQQPVEIRSLDRIVDLEPLRFYYRATTQGDPVFSFLQFFRVLEYYSVLRIHDDLDTLRRDRSLSSRDFARKIFGIVRSNDRDAMKDLVADLGATETCRRAKDLSLISDENGHLLGEALYEYRNAVVHAKYDHSVTLHAPSVFAPTDIEPAWTSIARDLARKALEKHSTRQH